MARNKSKKQTPLANQYTDLSNSAFEDIYGGNYAGFNRPSGYGSSLENNEYNAQLADNKLKMAMWEAELQQRKDEQQRQDQLYRQQQQQFEYNKKMAGARNNNGFSIVNPGALGNGSFSGAAQAAQAMRQRNQNAQQQNQVQPGQSWTAYGGNYGWQPTTQSASYGAGYGSQGNSSVGNPANSQSSQINSTWGNTPIGTWNTTVGGNYHYAPIQQNQQIEQSYSPYESGYGVGGGW